MIDMSSSLIRPNTTLFEPTMANMPGEHSSIPMLTKSDPSACSPIASALVGLTSTNSAFFPVDFCNFEGGGWLGNGTLIDYGGYPKDNLPNDKDGLMGIRLFTPQPNGGGEVWEDPATIHLTTPR
jgi:hypothetical protein